MLLAALKATSDWLRLTIEFAHRREADCPGSAEQWKAIVKEALRLNADISPTTAASSAVGGPADDGIPACLKLTQEQRKAAWEKYPPKSAVSPAANGGLS